MEKGKLDQFANQAIITVTESAANTLTFKKLETGISLTDKVAWLINRIEYLMGSVDATVFNATGDNLQFGLAVDNSFTTPELTNSAIISFNAVTRLDIGAAASGMFFENPLVRDYSTLPGGGLLTPPVPLYGFAKGTGLTAASTTVIRMWYSLVSLTPDQYWELVEARRAVIS